MFGRHYQGHRVSCWHFSLIVFVLVSITAGPGPLRAQTSWIQPGVGNWFEAANWSNGVPNIAVDATINNAGTSRILSQDAAAKVLVIGGEPSGNLQVEAGGSLTASEVSIGGTLPSTGVLTISGTGSRLYSPVGRIAYRGNGEFSIANGASASIRDIVVGWSSQTNGLLTVDGEGSVLENHDGGFQIGFFGDGEVSVENGGFVDSDGAFVTVGRSSGSGRVLVSGPGSRWTARTVQIGNDGYGEVVVSAGGRFVSRDVRNDSDAFFGPTMVVTGHGSSWQVTNQLVIDDFADLSVSEGGIVSSEISTLAVRALSNPTVTVAGPGSIWNSGALEIGVFGDGELEVTSGGNVFSDSATVAAQFQSVSKVLITGLGSEWNVEQGLIIGHRGRWAELTVNNGGMVSNGGGTIAIQEQTVGKVVVDGAGSTWTNSATLIVGQGGTAQLEIRDGALVASDSAFIALLVGSEGLVRVRGAGSRWDAGSALSIGYFGGAATMTITEGGFVGADNIIFGRQGVVATATGGTFAGDITLSLGGRLFNDGVVEGNIAVTGGGVLTGSGIFDGAVTVGAGGIVSPGSSPGTMSTPQTAWNTGGKYLWEISALASAGGGEGSVAGWDFWNTGALTIGGAFTIEMISSTGAGTLGAPAGWDPRLSSRWRIATADNASFTSLANLTLDTSDFTGPLGGGSFSLSASADGRDLFIDFAAVPEASSATCTMLAGIAVLAVARRRNV